MPNKLIVDPEALAKIREALALQEDREPKSDLPTRPDPVSDPNNAEDPDDCLPVQLFLSNDAVASIERQASEQRQAEPPPTQPKQWWTDIALGRQTDPVSPADAELVMRWVVCRLGVPVAPELGFPFHTATTVGELHQLIEDRYGAPGWTAFVTLWQSACDIPAAPPNKVLARRFRPGASALDKTAVAKPAVSLEALPSLEPSPRPDAATLEPGLRAALPGMPDRVAGWLCYQPRDPPPWRFRESEAEGEMRRDAEQRGAWAG